MQEKRLFFSIFVAIIYFCWGVLTVKTVSAQTILNVPETYPTIQEAVNAANDGDTIQIGAGVFSSTIRLNKHLTFQGAGKDVTILDAHSAGQTFYVAQTMVARFSDLTIRGGKAPTNNSRGGNIYNYGYLYGDRIRIEGGQANLGGAIYMLTGQIALNDSEIISNTALYGGGIYNTGGTIIINRSSLVGNGASDTLGGFLYNQSGSVTLSDDQLNENHAKFGGAIYGSGGSLSLQRTDLLSNSAEIKGGAIYLRGTDFDQPTLILSADTMTISGNSAISDGGGIYSWGKSVAMTLNQTAVSNNQAGRKGGGVVVRESSLTLTDSVVDHNQAGVSGGGIHGYLGKITLNRSSIVANDGGESGGGGHFVESQVGLQNSTVSSNLATKWGSEIALFQSSIDASFVTLYGQSEIETVHSAKSAVITLTNSVVTNVQSYRACNFEATTTLINNGINWVNDTNCLLTPSAEPSPLLSNLLFIDGQYYHEPLEGSPLIGSAEPTSCPTVDQRNQPRQPNCTIGAIETVGTIEKREIPTAISHKQAVTKPINLTLLLSLLIITLLLTMWVTTAVYNVRVIR